MFGIEWSEYAIIAIVALIVIGPKELPAVLRTIGQWTTKIRRMAAEFQGQFQEALREAEMADLKKEVDSLNDAARGFTSQFDDPLNVKEETNSEPRPDAAKLDTAKPDTAKPDDIRPDDSTKPAGALPESPPATPQPGPLHAGEGREWAEEAFPLAAEQAAVAPAPILDAASAQQVTPPAAESLLPEGSSQRSDTGGVHS